MGKDGHQEWWIHSVATSPGKMSSNVATASLCAEPYAADLGRICNAPVTTGHSTLQQGCFLLHSASQTSHVNACIPSPLGRRCDSLFVVNLRLLFLSSLIFYFTLQGRESERQRWRRARADLFLYLCSILTAKGSGGWNLGPWAW